MKTIGQKLKDLRLSKDLSMNDLSKIINNTYGLSVSKSMISRWENDLAEPTNTYLSAYAKIFNADLNFLLGIEELPENIQPIQRAKRLPILGAIACGEPILAEENFEGYIVIDGSIKADFTLRTIGDSMIEAGIKDGDLAFIKQQASVETGEIAAVYHDGEATLKKVYYTDDSVILQPCNSKYSPLVVKDDVRILGKLVGVYHHVE